MSALAIGMAFAPAVTRPGGGIHVSTAVIVIVVVLAVVGVTAILGWRSPDRSPGADTKAKRDRIEH